MKNLGKNALVVTGLRSIEECLSVHPERVIKLLLPSEKNSSRIQKIRQLAESNRIPVETQKGSVEEQVTAYLKPFEYFDFDQLVVSLRDKKETEPVLVLDGITDAHNLGAIIRSAAFFNVRAVVIPKDRSAQVTGTVYKVASGGLEHVPVCLVTNIVRALEELKEIGFWVVGFSEHAQKSLSEVKCDFKPVILIGNEEKGMRSLVRENCDYLFKIPSKGKQKSLNASVAAALAMQWAGF